MPAKDTDMAALWED